jgi:hypothetical protein
VAHKSTTVERIVARLATRSHGVVTRQELLAAGVTADEINQRLDDGSLLREYRGVYRVGHRAPSVEARYLAAVRACGSDAALSGAAAAFLYVLIRGVSPRPEVTAPSRRRVPNVITHRSRVVEATTHRGIPIVAVPDVLIDVAGELSLSDLARAYHEADVRYATTPDAVEAALARRPRAKGARNLRRVVHGDEPVSVSRLERRFHERLRENGLPLPVTNARVGGHRVDCRGP